MSRYAGLRPVLAATALPVVLAGSYLAAQQTMSAQAAHQAALDSIRGRAAAAARPRTPADTATGCNSGPLHFRAGSPAARRPWVLRRYVGTIGGQPATALLRWQNPDSVLGSFYYRRAGADYILESAARSRPDRPTLDVRQQDLGDDNVGQWQLPGRLGAALSGTWRGQPGSTPQAVRLHESYAGAVRLGIRTMYLTGGWSTAWEPDYESCPNVPTVSCEFWHLPVPTSLPAALRPQLSPGLAARRRNTRLGRETDARVAVSLAVRLNDFGLLSYETITGYDSFSGRHYEQRVGSPLLDLATGQAWPLDRLLQPGYWRPLRRLAAWHLRHDAKYRYVQWEWQQAPPAARDTAYRDESWRQPDLAPRPEAWVPTGAGLELT